MELQRFAKMATAGICAVALSLTVGGVANATPAGIGEEEREITSAIDRVSLLDKTKVVESAVSARDSIGTVSLGAGEVTVPGDIRDGVTFASPEGNEISVEPTTSTTQGKPFVMDDGGVTYTNHEGYAESVIVGHGSVQMLTTIKGADAPTEYHYTLDLKAGQKFEFSDGAPTVFNEDGSMELTVQAPWAVDAHGNAVSTHYEIHDNVLTQVVNHTGLSADSYPVVADPVWVPIWLVRCLVGVGIRADSILRSAQMGNFWAVFGKAAWHCMRGR